MAYQKEIVNSVKPLDGSGEFLAESVETIFVCIKTLADEIRIVFPDQGTAGPLAASRTANSAASWNEAASRKIPHGFVGCYDEP